MAGSIVVPQFGLKTAPAAEKILAAAKVKSGSATPGKTVAGTITVDDLRAIAEYKMPDLNAASLEAACSMIAGTARSMGVVVVD